MEEHLQQIRAAFEAGASVEARRAGIHACEVLATTLRMSTQVEAMASGEPREEPEAVAPPPAEIPELCDPREVPPVAASTTAPRTDAPSAATPSPEPATTTPTNNGGVDPAALAAIVAALRSLSPDQWLDLLIDKLRVAVRTMPAASSAAAMPTPPAGIAPPLPFAPAAPQPLRFRFVSVPRARKR